MIEIVTCYVFRAGCSSRVESFGPALQQCATPGRAGRGDIPGTYTAQDSRTRRREAAFEGWSLWSLWIEEEEEKRTEEEEVSETVATEDALDNAPDDRRRRVRSLRARPRLQCLHGSRLSVLPRRVLAVEFIEHSRIVDLPEHTNAGVDGRYFRRGATLVVHVVHAEVR